MASQPSHISMELRSHRDVMLLIGIPILSHRSVTGFRVDSVFVVGQEALWCAGVPALLGGWWGPSLDPRCPLFLESHCHESGCVLATEPEAEQEEEQQGGWHSEGDEGSELVLRHGRRLSARCVLLRHVPGRQAKAARVRHVQEGGLARTWYQSAGRRGRRWAVVELRVWRIAAAMAVTLLSFG